MTSNERAVMEMALYELTTLHGLVAADGAAPSETWNIDTEKVVQELRLALQ